MRLLGIVMALLLTGCGGIPADKEVSVVEYGPYPDNYEEIIKNFHLKVLKDPSSAQYQFFSPPTPYKFTNLRGSYAGYCVRVTYNAKNAFGAYTGFVTEGAIINYQAVVFYLAQLTCR